jgi:hypothetical protein
MKKISLALACIGLVSTSAQASVTITLEGGVLRTSTGTVAGDGGLILLVASTNPDPVNAPSAGFSSTLDGNLSTSVGTFLTADDQIIASFSISSVAANGVQGGYAYTLSNFNYSGGLTSGDQLQLYWFPTLTTSSTTFGVGTSYGAYRTDSQLNGSDAGWFLPSDGTTMALNFFTTSGSGSVADSFGNASLTTVPEPATTVALLGGAAGLFVMYRRRQRKVAPAAAVSTS